MLKVKDKNKFVGSVNSKDYFEGWFFKMVTADKKTAVSIIPGVALGENSESSHAFIQLNSTVHGSAYKEYPIGDFSYSKEKFSVVIDRCEFSDRHIALEAIIGEMSVMGKVYFDNITPFPTSLYAPDIMGPFSYVPRMQCNHGVVSMTHKLMGYLTIDKEIIDFSGGTGYIEKDYGNSFPSSWLWLQGNSFSKENTSVMLAVAHIPFGPISFQGIIMFFYLNGKMINISTYNGAKIKKMRISERWIRIELTNGKYTAKILCKRDSAHELKAPDMGKMSNFVKESINSTIQLCVTENESGRIIFKDVSYCCGCEVKGEQANSKKC